VTSLLTPGMLVAAWVGLAVIGALGGLPRRAGLQVWLLAAALALPVGIAVTSVTAFLWLVTLRPAVPWSGYIAVEILLAAGLTAAWLLRRPARACPTPQGLGHPTSWWLLGLGTISVGVLLVRLVRAWLIATFRSPLGDWDAWAIWNLRARFLFSAEAWRHGFSPEIAWSHPDYPLLLPSSVARGYGLTGEPTWAAPAVLALIFLLAIPAVAALAVARLRGTVPALVTAALCLGVVYSSLVFSQYADMPLALYFMGANALLLLAHWSPDSRWMWPLAGLMAGALVWTKNEGWVMLVALVATELLVCRWPAPAARPARSDGLAFALGLLPMLVVTIGFKVALAPANDMVARALWAQLASPARIALVARHLASLLVAPGPFHLPLVPLLAGYLLLQGARMPAAARPAVQALALRIGLVLAAYGAIYAITPLPLQWHLETSAQRLFMQVLPSLILMVLAAAGDPTHADAPEAPDAATSAGEMSPG